jgi:hypothetical protein
MPQNALKINKMEFFLKFEDKSGTLSVKIVKKCIPLEKCCIGVEGVEFFLR